MTIRLEHANISVRDVEGMIRFLQTAFPHFGIRHDESREDGTRWVHVGSHETYIALSQSTAQAEQRRKPYTGTPGINHLAFEVDDVDGLYERLKSAGYKDTTVPNKHPYRKRVYFNDPEGNDWEFVQYLSDDPSQRHDYDLPDQ